MEMRDVHRMVIARRVAANKFKEIRYGNYFQKA